MNAPNTHSLTTAAVVAHAKYWLWKAVTILILAPIYCSVIAEGLRLLVAPLGQKIHKLPIPAVSMFGQYQELRRLDLAIFMAVFLLVAVWWLWEQLLKFFLTLDESFDDSHWDTEAYRRLILILGFIVLGADGCLFYTSLVQLGWGGTKLSLSAMLATAAWLAVVVFVSLVSLKLRKSLDKR